MGSGYEAGIMIQGGAKANTNGKELEEDVQHVLVRMNYIELTPQEKKAFQMSDGFVDPQKGKWFCAQLRLERNIYEARHTVDFFLYNPDIYPQGLQIEVKWQSSQGSVDEKYVFTVTSLLQFRGQKIMILDGGGARQGAVQWIKRKAANSKGQFKLFNLVEFKKWARENL